ncbi:MAG: bifunctional DNA-binding transcriptional regulator/O6-methylguanine-DNA methyltransferase Ada [Bryobacteraceae bacterium]
MVRTNTTEARPSPDALGWREDYWELLSKRDRSADGKFCYSVETTGVYCRPSCPARLAKRENVRFHRSCADAEKAGFRPCKRCKPNGMSVAQEQAAKVVRLCRMLEESDTIPSLEQLAKEAAMTPFHLHRVFKAATGLTPRSYAVAQRSERVRSRLLSQGETITDAIYSSGYNSNGRFYDESGAILGMTPSKFRNGGANEQIKFAVGQCSLGAILVAQSQRGICAISLGDDPETLVRDLQDQFPRARFIGRDPAFEETVAKVVGFIDSRSTELDLPLDIRGTTFQQRVWNALAEVPSGSRLSYTELARRIGAPKAVRAVAQACGANRLAVAVPCHRVVRHDGQLAGYRWGVERKRRLLDGESES